MDTITYRVVFDAASDGYRYWWLFGVALGGLLVGLAALRLSTRPPFQNQRGRTLGWTFMIGVPALSAMVFTMSYQRYAKLRDALRTGHFLFVEGQISDYEPSDLLSKEPVSFQVSGHRYSYVSSVMTAGYNGSPGPSPIRLGSRVRIADVAGQIARLEVATTERGQ